MYRQPYKESFRYLCGLYQQSHAAKCKHNQVDGVVATRFLLGCVRQRLLAPALRARLEEKLRTIAERERTQTRPDSALAAKQAALAGVRTKRERAGHNLALSEGPEQYQAIAAVFEQFNRQERALEAEVRRLEQLAGPARDLDAEVEAALAGLDRMATVAAAPEDLASVGPLFQHLNARMYLRFTEARQKTRSVTKLVSGVVTFGATPPPVALYEGPTGRRYVKGPAISEEIAGPGSHESPGVPGGVPGREGESLGNVSRGEPRCTFVNEIIGLPLALGVFPEVYDFSGDAVLQLVEPGLYRKGLRVRRGAESTPTTP